jgi:hypothetical protein
MNLKLSQPRRLSDDPLNLRVPSKRAPKKEQHEKPSKMEMEPIPKGCVLKLVGLGDGVTRELLKVISCSFILTRTGSFRSDRMRCQVCRLQQR